MDENTIKDDAEVEEEVTPAEGEDLDDDALEGASGGADEKEVRKALKRIRKSPFFH